MKNYDKAIVTIAATHVYDFLDVNETEKDAIRRGEQSYINELNLAKSHFENDGGDYWEKRIQQLTKIVEAGCEL